MCRWCGALLIVLALFANPVSAGALYDNLADGDPGSLRGVDQNSWYAEQFVAPTHVNVNWVTLYMPDFGILFPTPSVYSDNGNKPGTQVGMLMAPETTGYLKRFRPVGGMGLDLNAGSYWVVFTVNEGDDSTYQWGYANTADTTRNAWSGDRGTNWSTWLTAPLVMKVETDAATPEPSTLFLLAPVAVAALYRRRRMI